MSLFNKTAKQELVCFEILDDGKIMTIIKSYKTNKGIKETKETMPRSK